MAKYSIGLILGLLLALTACEPPAPVDTSAAGDYNLTLYLQEQKAHMQAKKPMVLKSVTTGDKPVETVETDEIDWEDELAVFEQLDLRRPALEDYYMKQETVLENGDIAVEYKKKEESEPLVHYLYLTLTPTRQLKELNATLQDKNPLFYSRRHVTLQTEPETGNVSSYRITGVQKLIFSDSLHFKVDANL
ncbi:hypothetical protein ABID22_001214 [Pontibacter aydingkolensis]|uniref:Uncharacterized protein n=1 Tax=Pontibacter aydingkolensis TaxID=1911536 RepID=A0ABS7CTH9_9BACT|nr:hypothetical protein [Pontibacter aydingkolensis]MBW7467120.1 hypothetical protein [Pontibacter aydingkolensis]